jgi:glycosyltransferase involved in cell wall biosynthesis
MRPLNVAVINSELPYPPTAGNRVRTLNLIVRLARRHRITFLARRNAADREVEAASAHLRECGVEVRLVARQVARKSGPLFYGRLAANLLSPDPYSVVSHSSPAMRRAVRDHAAASPVDLWQAESPFVLGDLAAAPASRKVVVAHNVESLIWRRYHAAEANPLRRWYIGQQRRKMERFERRAYSGVARVVAVSAEDARLIRDEFGGRGVDVVDNGIDRAYFEAVQPARNPKQILFLGSFYWRPNRDAVDLLLGRIFPAVRAADPAARLVLVGSRPPDSVVRRAAQAEGVEIHADVPDVRPFLASSQVMVVPLRIGGGSRLKILEALAAGLPVVSTRVGAEGLEITPGRHYVAADEPEELVAALVEGLRDPSGLERLASAARPFVLNRYDWDALAGRLEEIWYGCVEG